MKRLLPALLAGFVICAPVIAQVSGFSQRGRVTQELQAEGLCIAHPSLPLNTKVQVLNTLNGAEIEATVTGRIPASRNRIADLSPSAWRRLALTSRNDVRIYINTSAKPGSAAQPAVKPAEPAAQSSQAQAYPLPGSPEYMSLLTEMIMDAMKEREAEEAEEREWERLIKETEEREQARFEKEAQAREFEEARMAREAQAREFEEARIAREALAKEIEELRMARETEVREARKREELRMARETEAREAREREEMRMAWEAEALIPAPVNEVRPQAVSPVPSPVYSAEPMATASPSEQQRPDVKIIPALPDPNNGKVYNLQLGAFSRQGTALEIASRVRNAGFDAVQEFSGSAYRVIAKDVPASMVPFAVQRLGAMGISEIWIKEK